MISLSWSNVLSRDQRPKKPRVTRSSSHTYRDTVNEKVKQRESGYMRFTSLSDSGFRDDTSCHSASIESGSAISAGKMRGGMSACWRDSRATLRSSSMTVIVSGIKP